MNLILLLDMSIPPSWGSLLRNEGVNSIHWSDVGLPNAADEAVMAHARAHSYVVLTHDLDFTHMLALTHAAGPSVILLRKQYALSQEQTITRIAQAILQHESMLASGALIVINAAQSRVRALPLHYGDD